MSCGDWWCRVVDCRVSGAAYICMCVHVFSNIYYKKLALKIYYHIFNVLSVCSILYYTKIVHKFSRDLIKITVYLNRLNTIIQE